MKSPFLVKTAPSAKRFAGFQVRSYVGLVAKTTAMIVIPMKLMGLVEMSVTKESCRKREVSKAVAVRGRPVPKTAVNAGWAGRRCAKTWLAVKTLVTAADILNRPV